MKIAKLFDKFRKAKKGQHILHPNRVIDARFTLPQHVPLGQLRGAKVFFTRRSLKHIAEKTDGKRLYLLISQIVHECDYIYRGPKGRFMFTKLLHAKINNKPHVAVVEIESSGMAILVTVFVAKQKYLKNFKILWRTAYPPSAYSL